MTTVVVLQPGYLPWLGFFDQLLRSDVFVYYDDVQYDKHGWRNRNRIKCPTGPMWLTVPVRHGGRSRQTIIEAEIENRGPWARKHLTALRQNYAGARYAETYLPALEEALLQPWKNLVDLDITVVELLCKWLDISRHTTRSSKLGIGGEKSERLANICRHFAADCYLSGNAAKAYLNEAQFSEHGIRIEWQDYEHPVYRQLHGQFLPYLSALDLILNEGPDSKHIIRGKK